MSELMSWKATISRWRVVTAEPGQDDTFVATFIEGKFAYLDGADDHAAAVNRAHAFLKDNAVAIKVLPVTFDELLNLLHITREDLARDMQRLPADHPENVALKKAIVERMKQVLTSERADGQTRAKALELLQDMGAMQ